MKKWEKMDHDIQALTALDQVDEVNHVIAKVVENYLDEDGIEYRMDEDTGTFEFCVTGIRMMRRADCIIRVMKDGLSVDYVLPYSLADAEESVSENMRQYIAILNRVDEKGCMSIDDSDGELRYRVALKTGNQIPEHETLVRTLQYGKQYLTENAPGFIGILFRDGSPVSVLRMMENLSAAASRAWNRMKENGYSTDEWTGMS